MAGLRATPPGTTIRSPLRLRKPAFSHQGSATGTYNIVEGLSFYQVTLTAAQINGMNAAPILLFGPSLAPPVPALNTIIVETITFDLIYGSAVFTGGGALSLGYGATASPAASATLAATFLTSPTVNEFAIIRGVAVTGASSAIVGAGIYLTNATQAFAAGTGSTVVVTVFFRKVNAS